MATTGIWKIEKRLDHVIDYITDIEKTINNDYGKKSYYNLHNINDYEDLDFITEKQHYVSSLNCSVESAYEEMSITKRQYSKTQGILGFHAFQSFKENEVTPEQAHAIGVKLAEEMWGDRFEVVISTHSNTKHIHNHFVINSVSFIDGKKYYDNRANYAALRNLSDLLCKEHNLSILEEKPCKNSGINYANYYKSYIQNDNYYTTTKSDIDKAIEQAYSYKDFENILHTMGYQIFYRGKNSVSVRRDPYKKNIRLIRNFGDDYSLERIKERIETTRSSIILPQKTKINKHYDKQKHKGLYGLFLYYCYLLKSFPQYNLRKQIPASIRADIQKMNSISKQTELLVNNNIETYEQFLLYSDRKQKELEQLIDRRSKLWYRYKKSKTQEEKTNIKDDINVLYEEITKIRKDVKLCDDIEERIKIIEKNISEFELQNGKEKEK